jgi:N-carbamoyl-L-amino-acid hydrolase
VNVNDLLAQLSPIGLDPAGGGYRRLSWTPAEAKLRNWFVDQARARNLRVSQDRNTNLWARTGDEESPGTVAVGSHLDSVRDGGAYDGPLGIASAFAALDLLGERGLRPGQPLAIVAFREEEGGRFGLPCLGSRLLTGALDPDQARALTDDQGHSLADAMSQAGEDAAGLGPEPGRLRALHSYVELHVEQGRGLVDLGSPVAVGSGIWPHGRWRLDFVGTPDHAGTTAMRDRNDPVAPFADTVRRVFAAALDSDARATFGRIEVVPNSTNSIPARVTAWLDARAATDATLDMVVNATGDDIAISRESFSPMVEFDRGLRDRLAHLLGGVPVLATAAGHDAGILAAAGVPSAMLFVRNPTGVSHSAKEQVKAEDCIAGTEALATVLADLGSFQ